MHFLRVHAVGVGKETTQIDDEAIEALTAHDWPGNIRELENVIERAVVLCDGPTIGLEDLPPEVRRPAARRGAPRAVASPDSTEKPAAVVVAEGFDETDDEEYVAFKRQRLLDSLREARGNKSKAARLLMLPRSTFCSKLAKHGLIAPGDVDSKPSKTAATVNPAASRSRFS